MLGDDEISWWNHKHCLWLLVDMVWISSPFAFNSGNVNVFVVNDSIATITKAAEYLHWSERYYSNCTHGWLFPGWLSSMDSDIFLTVVCFPTWFISHLNPFSSFSLAELDEISLLLRVVCCVHSLWPVGDHFDISDAFRGGIVFLYFCDWRWLLYLFDNGLAGWCFLNFHFFNIFSFFDAISGSFLCLLDFALYGFNSIRKTIFFANLMQLIELLHTDQAALDWHSSRVRVGFTQHRHISDGLFFSVHLTQHDS